MIKTCDCTPFQSCPECGVDLKKPGLRLRKTIKTPRIKKREIEQPIEQHCRRCNLTTGTECFRHAESRIVKLLAGGGIMGAKIPDTLTAWLCMDCDAIMSTPTPVDAIEQEFRDHALEWLLLIAKTHLV